MQTCSVKRNKKIAEKVLMGYGTPNNIFKSRNFRFHGQRNIMLGKDKTIPTNLSLIKKP